MNRYPDAQSLQKVLERVFSQGYAGESAHLLTKHRMAVGFQFHNPELEVVVDGRGDGVELRFGPSSSAPAPDVSFSMAGETIHRFWTGELNIVAAMTRGEVSARGNLIRALYLTPTMPLLQAAYRDLWAAREKALE